MGGRERPEVEDQEELRRDGDPRKRTGDRTSSERQQNRKRYKCAGQEGVDNDSAEVVSAVNQMV